MVSFAPQITQGTAIFMALMAASMWGTWFISLKHIGKFPLEAFYMELFTTSLIFVWTVALLVEGSMIFVNVSQVWQINPFKIIIVLLGGVSYVLGMFLGLKVMTLIGLTLSQPLQASIGIVLGTFITTTIGGIPRNLKIINIVISASFLLLSILFVTLAQLTKDKAQKKKEIDTGLSKDKKAFKKAIILVLLASVLTPGYSLALSYGLKTITQDVGLAVLPFMCLLVSGAFLGALVTSGGKLTKNKQWGVFLKTPFKVHKFGIMSGLFHYGGNIIHTFATGVLSSAISWPLGLTAGIWTQLWGIKYGEFKGAPKRAYLFQTCSFLFYVLGAYFIVMK